MRRDPIVRHCEPTDPAFGRSDDRPGEAIHPAIAPGGQAFTVRLIAALLAITFAAALGLLAAPALAETPIPHPPHGAGEHCVADTQFMRRNHMNMMFAHRTEAVHEGVRTQKFSLAGCVACHAVKGEDGKPVAYASEKHFCRSCHSYAAVSIDCFECHKSTPDGPTKTASKTDADAAKLAAYLREVKP